ncbi:MAG TPA: thioredoxin domain-containing protein [Myxococcales bacterium]|jgi:protein-disulfide isomerase|nr:thioredoxin domain-containing protein [Myxococcales bacterium]
MLPLFLAVLLAQGSLSEERARQILPRADLHDLSDAQRAQFLEIAGDTFDYAGCNDTLARCLAANVSDRHALRMAELVKALLLDGGNASQIVDQVERYYASFAPAKRKKLDESDCPVLGDPKAKVVVVEYSDYQCPHCARAQQPLHEMVKALPGKIRLCSKYFPLPGHPRAQVAAGCAEFARQKGKFWEMNQLLFAHQEELGDGELKEYARQIGVDGEAMLKQVYAGRFDAGIEKQKQEGVMAGVNATPTLFFNGRQYVLPIKPEFLVFSAQDEDEWQRNKGGWDKS